MQLNGVSTSHVLIICDFSHSQPRYLCSIIVFTKNKIRLPLSMMLWDPCYQQRKLGRGMTDGTEFDSWLNLEKNFQDQDLPRSETWFMTIVCCFSVQLAKYGQSCHPNYDMTGHPCHHSGTLKRTACDCESTEFPESTEPSHSADQPRPTKRCPFSLSSITKEIVHSREIISAKQSKIQALLSERSTSKSAAETRQEQLRQQTSIFADKHITLQLQFQDSKQEMARLISTRIIMERELLQAEQQLRTARNAVKTVEENQASTKHDLKLLSQKRLELDGQIQEKNAEYEDFEAYEVEAERRFTVYHAYLIAELEELEGALGKLRENESSHVHEHIWTDCHTSESEHWETEIMVSGRCNGSLSCVASQWNSSPSIPVPNICRKVIVVDRVDHHIRDALWTHACQTWLCRHCSQLKQYGSGQLAYWHM